MTCQKPLERSDARRRSRSGGRHRLMRQPRLEGAVSGWAPARSSERQGSSSTGTGGARRHKVRSGHVAATVAAAVAEEWTRTVVATSLGVRPFAARKRDQPRFAPPREIQHLQFEFQRWDGPIGPWHEHFGNGRGQVISLDGTEPLRSCNEIEVAKHLRMVRTTRSGPADSARRTYRKFGDLGSVSAHSRPCRIGSPHSMRRSAQRSRLRQAACPALLLGAIANRFALLSSSSAKDPRSPSRRPRRTGCGPRLTLA
jgi:hypothetical protein